MIRKLLAILILASFGSGAAARDGGQVMVVQIKSVEFSDALVVWGSGEGEAFTTSGDPMLSQVDPDGVYFVRKTDAEDYVQISVTSNPEHNFIGIVTTRVKESFEAREVLGE